MARRETTRTKFRPPELAAEWGTSAQLIIDLIRAGELGAVDVARPGSLRPRFLIDLSDIAEFERRREVHAQPTPRRRRPAPTIVERFV